MPNSGENLARALDWALRRQRENPDTTALEVVEEAATRFDLGPLDEEWLLREVLRETKKSTNNKKANPPE
jgi:hypothetical protein